MPRPEAGAAAAGTSSEERRRPLPALTELRATAGQLTHEARASARSRTWARMAGMGVSTDGAFIEVGAAESRGEGGGRGRALSARVKRRQLVEIADGVDAESCTGTHAARLTGSNARCAQ